MKNKDERQAIGMEFADKDCKHGDASALALRKLGAHASNKVAELAQQACDEVFGVEFHDVFLLSAQDLATSAIAKESQVDKVECGTYQGDKVSASTVGELTCTVSDASLLITHIVIVVQYFNFNLVHFSQSSSGSD